jgi:hypothetical protein
MWRSSVGRTTTGPQHSGGWRGGAAHGHPPRLASANQLDFFSPLAILKIHFYSKKTLFTHEKMEPVHFISLAKGPHLILGVEVVFWVFLTTFLVARI